MYADDTQIYLSFKPSCEMSITGAINTIELVVGIIKDWMRTHFLMLNDDKTEILMISSGKFASKLETTSVVIGNTPLSPGHSARNLGVIFDSCLSMDKHVNSVCRSAFHQLRNIRLIRQSLDYRTAETLIHSFVTSRLDYCNSLLTGMSKKNLRKLQLVQNTAARVLTGTRKYDHITPVLAKLHWLPVHFRIDFKVLLLTFKALNGQAPEYLGGLLFPYTPARSLRSSDKLLLKVPKTRLKTFGDRAFMKAAPTLWNSLPLYIRSAPSVEVFKCLLKTHFYNLAFKTN